MEISMRKLTNLIQLTIDYYNYLIDMGYTDTDAYLHASEALVNLIDEEK